ncbi:MAG: MMPL family transporter [Planctomycetia bacterium]|nr:MMPL family transporter [Planctomycetia bacterium]
MFRQLSETFDAHRRFTAFAVAATTLIAVYGLTRLEYDDLPRATFRSNDTDFARLEEAFHQFGADDVDCVFLVEADDIYTPNNVASLRRLIDEVNKIRGVESVQSLADIMTFPKRQGSKFLNTLLRPVPTKPYSLLPSLNEKGEMPTPEECLKARNSALAHPLAAQLMSEDGRATLVVARLNGGDLPIRKISPIITEMHAVISRLEHTSGLRIRLTGLAPIRSEIFESVQSESTKFICVGGLLAVAMATWMFRRVSAVFIVCISALLGAVWTIGAMGLVGEKMNIITTVLPTLVLVVGFTDAVHLMIDIRRERALGVPPREASRDALRHLGLACLLCSLTTAVGFGSLAVAQIEIIQKFGVICGLGAVFALVAVLATTPLLSGTKLGRYVQSSAEVDLPERLATALLPLVRWIVSHRRTTATVGILVTGLMSISMFMLTPSNQSTEALPTTRPSFQAIQELDRRFGGSTSAMILVDWDAPLTHDSGEVLRAIDDAQKFAETHPDVRNPISIVSLIRSLPDGRGTALENQAEQLRFVPDETVALYVRHELRRAIIRLRLQEVGSNEHLEIFDTLRTGLVALEAKHPGLHFHLTGTSVLASRNLNQMIADLAASLGSAAAIIFVVMTLGFGSFRLGLISIVPNLFPMVVTASVLVLTGRPLQMTSVIVFSICLGIAVDDTIHFINRFQRELRLDGNVDAAIIRSYRAVGSAMIMTSVVLIAGFGSLQISEMPTTRLFSGLSVLTIFAALIGDLIILPAMLSCFVPTPKLPLAPISEASLEVEAAASGAHR